MNVADLLDDATREIALALGLEKREARLEARVLAAHAWRVDAAWLIAHDTDLLAAAPIAAFHGLLAQRLMGHPIAYLTGTREFYGRPFQVSPAVLIPRPDTELLVELALTHLPDDRVVEVLDMGTGSGCIAVTLSLERKQARVTAIDRDAAALAVAQGNARSLNAPVMWMTSDWFTALDGRRFDLIVSNPPYIATNDPHLALGDLRFEPKPALAAGHDGLDDLRCLIEGASRHLKPGGWLLLEHGYNQAEAVCNLLHGVHIEAIQSWPDLAGVSRVSGGKLSE